MADPRLVPAQLPDLRNKLLDAWLPGHFYDMMIRSGMVAELFQVDPGAKKSLYATEQHKALSEASLWWVSTDMTALLNSAAHAIPSDCTPDNFTLPSEFGMVFFETPILGTDAHEYDVAELRQMAGGASYPAREYIDNVCNADGKFPINVIVWATGVQRAIPARPAPTPSISIASYQYNPAIGMMHLFTPAGQQLSGNNWLPLGKSDWPLEDQLDQKPFPVDDVAFFSFMEDRRLLAALCTLLRQEGIAETETVLAPRQVRRRSERAGANGSTVKIVRLRRVKHTRPDDGETHSVEWKNRWMVDAHWRWQAHGPGRRQRKLIFIAPYIKGPEDAPLKVKETVNVWIR